MHITEHLISAFLSNISFKKSNFTLNFRLTTITLHAGQCLVQRALEESHAVILVHIWRPTFTVLLLISSHIKPWKICTHHKKGLGMESLHLA